MNQTPFTMIFSYQIMEIHYLNQKTLIISQIGDQFKNLADTYINQLKILFKENCENPTDRNEVLKFFEALMRMFEIPIQYYNISHMRKQYQIYEKILKNHFSFNDIKQFFYWTYLDSKSIKQNPDNSQNKWTLLKKYLMNSFLNHLN